MSEAGRMKLQDFPDDDDTEPDLTPRQQEVLTYIANRIEHDRMPPTRREISEHFGWRSPNAAQLMVRLLVQKGCLVVIDDIPRGLRLPDRC